MNIKFINFEKNTGEPHIRLIKDIIEKEYSELSHLLKEITVIAGRTHDVETGFFDKTALEMFPGINLMKLGKESFAADSMSIPPKGCIRLNLDKFELFENWRQKLSIRHECCHLLHSSEAPPTFRSLHKEFSLGCLKDFFRHQQEHCAQLCVLKRYPEDWLREPYGLPKQSPRIAYDEVKKDAGPKVAVQLGIVNIVNILSALYLYRHVPSGLRSKIRKKERLANRCLQDFLLKIKEDMPFELETLTELIAPSDFLSAETYFGKVQKLLTMIKHHFD